MQLWGYVKGRDLCGAGGGHGEGEEGKEGRGFLRPVTGQEESFREAGEQHLCC